MSRINRDSNRRSSPSRAERAHDRYQELNAQLNEALWRTAALQVQIQRRRPRDYDNHRNLAVQNEAEVPLEPLQEEQVEGEEVHLQEEEEAKNIVIEVQSDTSEENEEPIEFPNFNNSQAFESLMEENRIREKVLKETIERFQFESI